MGVIDVDAVPLALGVAVSDGFKVCVSVLVWLELHVGEAVRLT